MAVGQVGSPCDPLVRNGAATIKGGGALNGEEGLVPARMYIPQLLRYFVDFNKGKDLKV